MARDIRETQWYWAQKDTSVFQFVDRSEYAKFRILIDELKDKFINVIVERFHEKGDRDAVSELNIIGKEMVNKKFDEDERKIKATIKKPLEEINEKRKLWKIEKLEGK